MLSFISSWDFAFKPKSFTHSNYAFVNGVTQTSSPLLSKPNRLSPVIHQVSTSFANCVRDWNTSHRAWFLFLLLASWSSYSQTPLEFDGTVWLSSSQRNMSGQDVHTSKFGPWEHSCKWYFMLLPPLARVGWLRWTKATRGRCCLWITHLRKVTCPPELLMK